jgi:tRNA pseudouridine synthase 9
VQDPPGAEDYVLRDGLRYVKPYFFEHYAHVKRRWEGRTVVELFTAEFKGRSREYYQAALQAGRLRVDTPGGGKNRPKQPAAGPPTGEDTRLRNGQVVRHLVHRHEPPVRMHCCELETMPPGVH